MGVAEGLGSRKVEVLADTAITLEQGRDGLVASEVIQKLLSVSCEEWGWREGRGGMCRMEVGGRIWRVYDKGEAVSDEGIG